MAVSLIALDMDGTLMDHSHLAVSTRNRRALEWAAAQGIHIVLSSGRPRSLVTTTAAELGYIRYAITANGGSVWDFQTDSPILERPIPAAETLQILRILTDYPIAVEVYCGGDVYVDKHTWRMDRYEKQPVSFLAFRSSHNMAVDSLVAATEGRSAEKFNVDGIDSESKAAILARLAPLAHGLSIHFNACYDNLEISRADATKGSALESLCQVLGVGPKAVMAFGDSSNDITMLQWAEQSYAMANGEPAAIQAARYAAPSNEESGVAIVLERLKSALELGG